MDSHRHPTLYGCMLYVATSQLRKIALFNLVKEKLDKASICNVVDDGGGLLLIERYGISILEAALFIYFNTTAGGKTYTVSTEGIYVETTW